MITTKHPKVSVIVPCYNHEAFVGEAVESVLRQSMSDLELIVVDDGSSDRSVEIVTGFKDDRLKLIVQVNSGAHTALNRGAALASAPWIAFLNSDDRFTRSKLERHLAVHLERPDLEASASRVRYVNESGNEMPPHGYLNWRYMKQKEAYCRQRNLLASLFVTNHLVTSSSLFMRREVFRQVGGFASLRYVHDWFMFLSLASRGRFHVIEEALTDYRRHSTNTISENDDRGRVEDNFVIEWQLSEIFSSRQGIIGPLEAHAALSENRRVNYRLMVLFEMWRKSNLNDISKCTEIFSDETNIFLKCATEVVRRDKTILEAGSTVKRMLGNWYPKVLDCVAVLAFAVSGLYKQQRRYTCSRK